MITWPSFTFPPVNLNTIGARNWPKGYLDLEREYCQEEQNEFEKAKEGTLFKEVCRLGVKEKREEFNKLWNERARG